MRKNTSVIDLPLMLAISIALISGNVLGQESEPRVEGGHNHHHHHGQGSRQQGAHLHGQAELDLVLEDERLDLVLRIPGMDLVGFETHPSDENQRRKVKQGAGLLGRAEDVFVLPTAAQCSLSELEVLSSMLNPKHNSRDSHAEFEAYYGFECEQPMLLDDVEVRIFQHLPALRHIQLRWILDRGQGAVQLTPEKPGASLP